MKLQQGFLTVILCVCLALFSTVTVLAVQGEGNVDSGGGHVNPGVEGYKWTTGYEGVRITIVDSVTGQQVALPIDFTNSEVFLTMPNSA